MRSPAIGTLDEGLRWLGRRGAPAHPGVPVEIGSVQAYCEVVEDASVLRWDPDAAGATVWGEPLAPWGSTLRWLRPPSWTPSGGAAGQDEMLHRSVPLPHPMVMAVSTHSEHALPLRLGDVLSYEEWLAGIRAATTRLGEGCFVSVVRELRRADGARVATLHTTNLRYTPRSDGQDARGARERAAPPRRDSAPAPRSPGDAHEVAVELTYERCVRAVAATRDFNPIHYDRDVARSAGFPDVLVNTCVHRGLVERAVAEWAGPDAFVRHLGFDMGSPAFPGDVLVARASVVDRGDHDAVRWAELRVAIVTERAGTIVSGCALVVWPEREQARAALQLGLPIGPELDGGDGCQKQRRLADVAASSGDPTPSVED